MERKEEPKGEASLTQNNNAVRTLRFPAGALDVRLPDALYPSGKVGDVELITDLHSVGGRNAEDVEISGRFKWSQDYLNEEIQKGVYLAIKTTSMIPYYRKDYQKSTLRPTKILADDLVGDVLQANAELDRLSLGGAFDYPKPTSLIRFLMTMVGVGDGEVIMDFFAGSGTTAHAVALQNAADGGKRRSILVNIPEDVDAKSEARKAGFETVSAITSARLKAVADTVEGAREMGLRTLALDASNFGQRAAVGGQLDLRVSTLASAEPDWQAIAAEVLIKEGVTLDQPWQRHRVGEAEIVVSGGVAVVLSTSIDDALVGAALDLQPRVAVFLEDGFADADAVKANAVSAARHRGITMKTV